MSIRSGRTYWPVWVAPVAIYIALVSGAGNPIRCSESVCEVQIGLSMLMVFLMVPALLLIKYSPRIILQVILLLLSAWCLALSGNSELPEFVWSKSWGGLLASAIILIYMSHVVLYYGHIALARGLAVILFVVLLATLLFKIWHNGLLDRDLAYIANGPIVFGWLMGIGGLAAAYTYLKTQRMSSLLLWGSLSVGVLWSVSKGPILAYLISCAYLMLMFARYCLLLKCILIFGAALKIIEFDETRFMLVATLMESEIDYSEGSVGARLASYETAWQLIRSNYLVGIGAGNFAIYEPLLMYPHNVHLEILLEYGIFAFFIYLILLCRAIFFGESWVRAISIFMTISMLFSGDVSYIRYILPFLLLGTTISLKMSAPSRQYGGT